MKQLSTFLLVALIFGAFWVLGPASEPGSRGAVQLVTESTPEYSPSGANLDNAVDLVNREISVVTVGIVAELPNGSQVIPSSCSIRVGNDLLRFEPTEDGELTIEAVMGQELLVRSEWINADGVQFEGMTDWQVPNETAPVCVVPIQSSHARLVGEVTRGGDLLPFFPVFFSNGRAMQHGTTNAEGRYEFGMQGGGPCVVQFGSLVAPDARRTIELVAGEVRDLSVDLSPGSFIVELKYPDGSAVEEGVPVVISPASPVSSPIVDEVFMPRTKETDSFGMVEFSGVPEGECLVDVGVTRAATDHLAERSASPCIKRVAVPEGGGTHTIVLPQLTFLRVETIGQILDMPVQEIVTPVWIARRDDKGEFRPFSRFSSSIPTTPKTEQGLVPVPPGEVLIRAGGYPYGFGEERVEIKEGEENYVRLELNKEFLQGVFVFTRKQYETIDYLYILDKSGALVTRVSVKGRLKPTASGSFGGEVVTVNRPYAVEGGDIAAKFGVPSSGEYLVLGKAGHNLIRFESLVIEEAGLRDYRLTELANSE